LSSRILALAVACCSTSCGYHLVGTSSALPEDLKTLHIATYKNLTSWPDMDQRLTEAVVREWVRRRRFELVDTERGSDLVLRGVITSIVVAPVTFDQSGRALEYQMTLTSQVQLEDVRGSKPVVLWLDKAFSRRTSYEVNRAAANYFDRQIEAMEEISEEYARALVTSVLEGF